MVHRLSRQTGLFIGILSISISALAGRPLAVDDADPLECGQFQFDIGTAYEKDAGYKHWDVPFGLTYGLAPRLDVGAAFGGQFEERTELSEDTGRQRTENETDVGDLSLGAKWQAVESCPLGARHALAAAVKVPTADDQKEMGSGKTDYDLTWIISKSIGDKTGVHLNLGYAWIGGPEEDILHYGLALDYQLEDSIQWVGEMFAERELTGDADTVAQFNTGFRWNPADSLTLDIAAGSKLSNEAPDFIATLGLTWEFGFASENN